MYQKFFKMSIFLVLFTSESAFYPVFAIVSLDNLSDSQVIQRTSEAFADVAVFGSHNVTVGSHIQLRVIQQESKSALKGFNWIPIDTLFSTTTWKGVIPKLPVGGEYSLEFRLIDPKNGADDTFKTIEHVLVGDIWGAAGQSNMVGMGNVDQSDPPIDQVHIITYGNPWKKAQEPLGDCGAGPALRFAIQIFRATGVPVGLAYHTKGGTGMDFWSKGGEGYEKWTSVITNAGGVLKGVIWYQGERNMVGSDDEVMNYKTLMTTFMKDIRRHANNATLPWILAQIATLGEAIADDHAMIVREAQRSISLEDRYAETITTIDLPRMDIYHFDTPHYQIIGNRFASAALHKVYGQKTILEGPRFLNAHFIDSAQTDAVVSFQALWGALAPSTGINGFYVLEMGNVKYPLSLSKQNDSTIALHFGSRLSSETTIGYGYGYDPVNLNLTDSSTIPAQPFYNLPIFPSKDPQGKFANNSSKNGATATDGAIELQVSENPFRLYSFLLISFPEVKNSTAQLSVYSVSGIPVRHIKLSQGQDRCTISRRFLPSGCYVLVMRDGNKMGTKRIFWKFAAGK